MAVTAASLFRDVFLPLYPDDAKADLGQARSVDANPAGNPSILAHLDDAAGRFAEIAPSALDVSAATVALDGSDASMHRLSAVVTPAARDRLLGMGAIGTPDNALFNFVVHGAAYTGACIVKNHDGRWAVRRPLWESLVRLRSRAGEGDLAVFHWWIKSLVDDPPASIGDRYRAYVEVPCARPEALPVIAPADRRLPKLAKPRYAALHQYLRAHLPELRDVGELFPSPERFEELAFSSLSFLLVGGGRMLVISGRSTHADGGLHAFWLTKEGFEKAAFWACEAFPEPIVRVKAGAPLTPSEETIEVVLAQGGATRVVELLFWGP